MSNKLKNANDVREFLKEKKLPDNFCIIPFINLILGPGGDVSVCRQKGTEHVIGSLKENTLEEIWNGDYLKQWRQEFLDGTPKICADEIKYVHCHLAPEHYWNIGELNQEIVQPYPFKKLTANLNGECNLKCIMCDVWRQENGFYNEDNFWKSGRTEIFPFIKEIEMLSGEPLIQDDTFKFMDELLAINPDVEWTLTTNGIWEFEGKIESYLKKLNIKRFIFSIDSFNEDKYRKIRVGGELQVVLSNLEKVSKFLDTTVHFVVMTNNIGELNDAVKITRETNSKLVLDLCVDPKGLSILFLPESERIKIIERYLAENSWSRLVPLMNVLLRLLGSLESGAKKALLLKILDKKEAS